MGAETVNASAPVARPAWLLSGTRQRLLAFSVLAYLVSTSVGVVMRFEFLGLNTGIPFDHLLHSHSHTLYFGWAGLAILVLATDSLPARTRTLRWATIGIAVSMPPMFIGFLYLGYHPVTIAISTVVMLLWYATAFEWWRAARTMKGAGVRLLRGALGYLVASSLGIWVLAFLQASGVGTPLSEGLAVHAFLSGFAWFMILGIAGLVVSRYDNAVPRLGPGATSRAGVWWVSLAWITFPLGVSGGPEISGLGPLSRIAGILLLYPAWLWVRSVWSAAGRGGQGRLWRASAAWFALPALGAAAVGIGGSALLDVVGRQGVVIYLHALLAGFVTTVIVLLATASVPQRFLQLHSVALAVMLVGLGLLVFGEHSIGSSLAAWSALALWLAGIGWARPLLGMPSGVSPESEADPVTHGRIPSKRVRD